METREEHYASMMQAVQRYAPSADLEEIQKAYEYADRKHKDQLRKSGEPYIIHPLAVAEIVAEIGLDTDAIVAALYPDEQYVAQKYLYFCSTDPASGELHFSKTLEEHNAAVAMYRPLWEEYDRSRGLN